MSDPVQSEYVPEKPPRGLNAQELQEFQELLRLVGAEKFKAIQFKANTALLNPGGQELAEQQERVANLVENVKNGWLAKVLADCGWKEGVAVNINSATGEVVEKKDEPTDSPKATE